MFINRLYSINKKSINNIIFIYNLRFNIFEIAK